MKHLAPLYKYFWKYRYRLFAGLVFVFLSNYFSVLAPQITGFIIDKVQTNLGGINHSTPTTYNSLVKWFIHLIEIKFNFQNQPKLLVAVCSLTLLLLAIMRGFFLFLMRQTIIVMSRFIEYDQKNEIYTHYQKLDTSFYKMHQTGDLMNRISEDVSRVRMFSGPAVMYIANLLTIISMSVFFMWHTNKQLTLYVLAPLPILAITIYFVNNIINKKSESIQTVLSTLTTQAQESYSGIRVIKSYVQESAMIKLFSKQSELYRKNAISLAKVEAIYFPAITLLIGISTLTTIFIGGLQVIHHQIGINVLVEFVMYINMLTFPVSAIGLTASMVQRAIASQKRINEFLHSIPIIKNDSNALKQNLNGSIILDDVSFVYPHTGITALQQINLKIQQGQKISILGKTGSGKSTLVQLLLRFYDTTKGTILINDIDIKKYDLKFLRKQISYVPQEVFLFSNTIKQNIAFSQPFIEEAKVIQAAKIAQVDAEISQFSNGYETILGERGITLSGGQKQRISISRALIKSSEIVIIDDSLSAVDVETEQQITNHLENYIQNKTALIVSHRIFLAMNFDQIIVLDKGKIIEHGTHQTLLQKNGFYAQLYSKQIATLAN